MNPDITTKLSFSLYTKINDIVKKKVNTLCREIPEFPTMVV